MAGFSYAHVPWIKPHQRALEGLPLPKGYEKFRIFAAAVERFVAAGYRFIGMDHFASPGDELSLAPRAPATCTATSWATRCCRPPT